MYSFTQSRKKELFSLEVKLLLGLFGTIIFIMFIISGLLEYKVYTYKQNTHDMVIKQFELKEKTKKNEYHTKFIEKQKEVYDEVVANTLFLKESIKNLFDLIPDKITLDSAKLEENKLILHGITPTKEVYQFLLLAPLESIFNENYTTYYQMDNGWYKFQSTNILGTYNE